MGRIVLVTGGARSGKSRFAENYIKEQGSSLAYIATAQVFDEEMKQRVDIHQKRRSTSWNTIEAPFAAEKAIEACNQYDAILFDCLTIYMSNIICLPHMEKIDQVERQQEILSAIKKLVLAAVEYPGVIAFVTNEVGCGIVPESELGRQYRDIAGFCNQYVAENADEVYFTVSGIPIKIK